MKKVYLDYNATTPVSPEVLDAMTPFFCEKFGNPSSSHSFGSEAASALKRKEALPRKFKVKRK